MARRSYLILAVACCLAACLGAGLAYSPGASPLCAKTFVLYETIGTIVVPPGQTFATGVTGAFKNSLTLSLPSSSSGGGYTSKKNSQVGYAFGTCTVFNVTIATPSSTYYKGSGYKKPSTPTPSSAELYCDLSLVISDLGTIELQGPQLDKAGAESVVAIVGGTGAYEGASGHVVIKTLAFNEQWKNTIYLESEPDCGSY